MTQRFPCYLVSKDAAGKVSAALSEATLDDLPPGDVLIRAAYSSVNYKDALAATGHPGVVRKFPHVPGIDVAGRVEESSSSAFRAGDEVLVTGYGLGADRWGGYAGLVRVSAEHVVPLPAGLTPRESMALGTAGFTAAQCVAALQHNGVAPGAGDVVVTGASGGVGSLAVAILAKLGYLVVASSGKPQAEALLRRLGAAEIVPREALADASGKPLLAARFAGAVDTVGGPTLATILRSLRRGGCAAACGLVGGAELQVSVYPFILRHVTLAGIDSNDCPMPERQDLWSRLAGDWKPGDLDSLTRREVPLAEIAGPIDELLHGQSVGRVVVGLA
jgi:putative YhdH/YhfP family quinone oxidoreductase